MGGGGEPIHSNLVIVSNVRDTSFLIAGHTKLLMTEL